MPKFDDLTGRRFSEIEVIESAGRDSCGLTIWRCRCNCGNETIVRGSNLRAKRGTKSCGCVYNRRNGQSTSTEYMAWKSMLGRCYRPSHVSFKNYGARGIEVCESWRASFDAFPADMGRRPTPNHSLDRIDNDGDYTPDNCRWASSLEQHRNTRRNRFITYTGRTAAIAKWASSYGLNRATLTRRLDSRDTPPYAFRPSNRSTTAS